MNNRPWRSGPISLSSTLTTNVLNPPTLTGGVNVGGVAATYLIIKKTFIISKVGGDTTISFWLGATGANTAGTEVIGSQRSLPGRGVIECFDRLRLDAADFLVGGCSAGGSAVAIFEGEIGVA
jgi:hypothetical protein